MRAALLPPQRHQNEIARELGLSSSKMSRLLKRAFAEGLVRVEIELPKRPRLEAALVERFRLRDAVVIPLGETRDLSWAALALRPVLRTDVE